MSKLRSSKERSYFRFPVSLLSMVDGADQRPDLDPDSDGRRLGLYIIAYTLVEKGKAQMRRLGEEYLATFGESEFSADAHGRGFAVLAGDWLAYHRPETLPEGIDITTGQGAAQIDGAVLIALAPGRDFAAANAPKPRPDTVTDGGRLGGLGIKAGPLPDMRELRAAYWDAAAHVEAVAEVTGGRSMEATVRADFVRELAAGRRPLREFRILAAITAKLGGPNPYEQTTDEHLALLASGFHSRDAFASACRAAEDSAARELAFRESDEFKAWPEADRLAALSSVEEGSLFESPRILFTDEQVRYTRRKLCSPRGVFVSYLYNRRRLYLAHPARLTKYAQEPGEGPELTLARLVEAKYARADERKHATYAAAAIAKAEREAAAAVRERDLAARLAQIADAAGAGPLSEGRPALVRQSPASRPGRVPPYIETPSENQQHEKQQQQNPSRTAADGAAARVRGILTKGTAGDRGPATAAPLPALAESLFGAPAILTGASPRQNSQRNEVRETDPTPEPTPPGGGRPVPVPVSEAATPVPITQAYRTGDEGAPPPLEPTRPAAPPPGALVAAEAFRRALERGDDTANLLGIGGPFHSVETADGRTWYVERDPGEVAAERARMAAERHRSAGTGA